MPGRKTTGSLRQMFPEANVPEHPYIGDRIVAGGHIWQYRELPHILGERTAVWIWEQIRANPCEHSWHKGGTVNGRTVYDCQWCGAKRYDTN